MHIATMETPHFSFLAAGQTNDQARQTMAAAFSTHLVQWSDIQETTGVRERERWMLNAFGDDRPFTTWADFAVALDEYFGINVVELFAGQAARDGEEFYAQ